MLDSFRRERFLAAFAEATAQHGYRKITIDHVVKAARTSRSGFYEYFENKDDAFRALLRGGFEAAEAEIEEACIAAGPSFPRRVRAALLALVGWLAANPALAHVCLIDAFAAGPDGVAPQLAFSDLLAARLRAAAPPGRERSGSTEDLLVSGVLSVLARRLAAGRRSELHSLIEPLAEFVLAPYRGEAELDAARLDPLAASARRA